MPLLFSLLLQSSLPVQYNSVRLRLGLGRRREKKAFAVRGGVPLVAKVTTHGYSEGPGGSGPERRISRNINSHQFSIAKRPVIEFPAVTAPEWFDTTIIGDLQPATRLQSGFGRVH